MSFTNIEKDFVSIEKFTGLINDTDSLITFLWHHKDTISKFQSDLFRNVSSIEDFIQKNFDNIKKAISFVKENNLGLQKSYHLYRAVCLGPEDVSPNLDNLGICWTVSEEQAELFSENIIPNEMKDDPNFAICILEADISLEDIDLLGTLILNAIEPTEKEIRTYQNAKAKNIEYYVL